MNNQDDTERIISNINRKTLEERLGIKPESSIDYNRGRINVPPKHQVQRNFASSGKKVTSSKKADNKFIKFLGYALLLGGLTAAILASRNSKKPIDPRTGFNLETPEPTYTTTQTYYSGR